MSSETGFKGIYDNRENIKNALRAFLLAQSNYIMQMQFLIGSCMMRVQERVYPGEATVTFLHVLSLSYIEIVVFNITLIRWNAGTAIIRRHLILRMNRYQYHY